MMGAVRSISSILIAFVSLSACNPFSEGLRGSKVSANYRPGFQSERRLNLEPIPALLRGGQSLLVIFDLPRSVKNAKLEFSQDDGISWEWIADLSVIDRSHLWTVNSIDTVMGRIRIAASDHENHPMIASSDRFSIDSQAPLPPDLALASAAVTNDRAALLTLLDCPLDQDSVLIWEGAGSPSTTSTGWQACSTVAGSITHIVSAADGSKELIAFFKDEAGNISAPSSSVSVLLDRTPPMIDLETLKGGELFTGLGGTFRDVKWSVSDSGGSGLGANAISIELSDDGGNDWSPLVSNVPTSGPYSWTPGPLDGSAFRIRVSVSDAAGNVSTSASSSDFSIDSVAPRFIAGGMKLNGSFAPQTVSKNLVAIDFRAEDSVSPITHFCLKIGSGAVPASDDDCWRSVSEPGIDRVPAKILVIEDFDFTLGFTNGSYQVSAWAKDAVGNVSELENSGTGVNGKDSVSASYFKPQSVTIGNAISVSSESPDAPLTESDFTIAAGAPLFVKWKTTVPVGNEVIAIWVEYLVDEASGEWIKATNDVLVDGSNGCAVDGIGSADDGFTGCFRWTSPSDSPFRTRVGVEDAYGSIRYSSAQPNNTTPFVLLAGNLDTGLDGDPLGVMLNYEISTQQGTVGSLAIDAQGVVYFRDSTKGILRYDPGLGKVSVLFKKDESVATAVFNDVSRSDVTLKKPTFIDVDAGGNLYVFDQNVIHKWSPSTDRVTTVLGGGGSVPSRANPTVDGGRNLSIVTQNVSSGSLSFGTVLFHVLSNGDIIFRADFNGGAVHRIENWSALYYRAATDTVHSFFVDPGVGPSRSLASFDPVGCYLLNFTFGYNANTLAFNRFAYHPYKGGSADGSACALVGTYGHDTILLETENDLFDENGVRFTGSSLPSSSHIPLHGTQGHVYRTFTGKNGRIYLLNTNNALLYSLNPDTNAYELIYGNSSKGKGECADGIAANQCQALLSDAYVDRVGRVYVVDRGQIRMIDQEKNVRTIVGQSPLYLGSSPFSARFSEVGLLRYHVGSNQVAFSDPKNGRLYRMTLGGAVSVVMDGTNPTVWNTGMGDTFDFFQGTNDIIRTYLGSGTGYAIRRQNASTGVWSGFLGTNAVGAFPVMSADGEMASQINLAGGGYANNGILGWLGGKLYLSTGRSSGATTYDSTLKSYDSTNSYRQTHIMGVAGTTQSIACSANNVSSATCAFPYNAYRGTIAALPGGDLLIPNPGGSNIIRVGALKSVWLTVGQTYRGVAIDVPGNQIYFCGMDSASSTNRIIRMNASTSAKLVIPGWPDGYECRGISLIVDDSTGSRRLIFPVGRKGENGVMGIGSLENVP